MTTITYKNGVIAYDSRLTSGSGDTILSDDYDKHRFINSVHFYLSGAPSDYDGFIKAYFSGELDPELDVSAIMIEKNTVYAASTNANGKVWKLDITNLVYAIGSGSDHALTAMDLNCNAVEAIKYAKLRCNSTGGKIRSKKIN